MPFWVFRALRCQSALGSWCLLMENMLMFLLLKGWKITGWEPSSLHMGIWLYSHWLPWFYLYVPSGFVHVGTCKASISFPGCWKNPGWWTFPRWECNTCSCSCTSGPCCFEVCWHCRGWLPAIYIHTAEAGWRHSHGRPVQPAPHRGRHQVLHRRISAWSYKALSAADRVPTQAAGWPNADRGASWAGELGYHAEDVMLGQSGELGCVILHLLKTVVLWLIMLSDTGLAHHLSLQ